MQIASAELAGEGAAQESPDVAQEAETMARRLRGPRHYQWLRGAEPLPDASTGTLQLTDAYALPCELELRRDAPVGVLPVLLALAGRGEAGATKVQVRPQPELRCVVWTASGVVVTEGAVVETPSPQERVREVGEAAGRRLCFGLGMAAALLIGRRVAA